MSRSLPLPRLPRHAALRRALLVLLLTTLLPAARPLPVRAQGVIALSAPNVAVTQNFDTLAASGASALLPAGWEMEEAGTRKDGFYDAGDGSLATGGIYSFGAVGSSERALGGVRTGDLFAHLSAIFVNQTGQVITSLAVSYTGEQWRLGHNNAAREVDALDFEYSTNATGIGDEEASIWVAVDALDFESPWLAGSVGALDGNADTFRTLRSATIGGLAIEPGASFRLRWTDRFIYYANDGLAIDDFSLTPGVVPWEDSAPRVLSVTPADGAAAVAPTTSFEVRFSEPVDAPKEAFLLTCLNFPKAYALSAGPAATYTLQPLAPLPWAERCALIVVGPRITDVDASDPPDHVAANTRVRFVTAPIVCTQPFTPTYALQGAGEATPLAGQVTTQGVVVGDFEYPGAGAASEYLRGYFVQDAAGDGDGATSDAIFVANNLANSVALGDIVRVSGVVSEVDGQTQLAAAGALTFCGQGTVTPTEVTLPLAPGVSFERFEGMLVQLPQTLAVTDSSALGTAGEVMLAGGARLLAPTDVAAPGADAAALHDTNARNVIVLDDATQRTLPDPMPFGRGGLPLSAANTLRAGDTLPGLTGILMQTSNGLPGAPSTYRLRPANSMGGTAPVFAATNARAAAPARAGRLRVAALDAGNLFNSFKRLPAAVGICTAGVGGAPIDCLGAESALEYTRQRAKLVAALAAANAEILLLAQVENDGYAADSTAAELVTALNGVAGAGVWALLDVDAATGRLNALGTQATRVLLLYKPAAVTPSGAPALLDAAAFVNGGEATAQHRPALAQAFIENATGARLVVSTLHLRNRDAACDSADGAGACAALRAAATVELASWLGAELAAGGEADLLLMGSFNSYRREAAMANLQAAGLSLLQPGAGVAVSAGLDGAWGALDHALASAALQPQVAAMHVWAINADEPVMLDYNTNDRSTAQLNQLYAVDPWRAAERNLLLVDLNLTHAPPSAAAGGPYVAVEGGSIALSGAGSDPEELPVALAWDLNGDGSFEAAGATPALQAADGPSVRTLTLRVTDAAGLTAFAQATLTVANAPPVLGALVAPGEVHVGAPIYVLASFSDAGALDTQTALWSWGNGGTAPGTVSGVGSGTVSGSTSYAAPGTYTLRLTLTDKDGGQAGAEQTVRVVAAPPPTPPPAEAHPLYLPLVRGAQ